LNMRQALGDEAGAALSAHNLQVLEQLQPAPVEQEPSVTPLEPKTDETAPPQQETDTPPPQTRVGWRVRLRRIVLATLAALVILTIGAFGLWYALWSDEEAELSAYWKFGDAWNALDNETWTQQIIVVAAGGDGDYVYSVKGQTVDEMFAILLPFCDGSQGMIQVQSGDGQTVQIEYEFDSPFCRGLE